MAKAALTSQREPVAVPASSPVPTMDIPRAPRRRWARRLLMLGGAAVLLGAAGMSLLRLERAAPTVARSSVWTDTVKRGPMVRQVRGAGTLVSEEIRWVTAGSAGRIEQLLLLPGVEVQADTVIVTLSNPELAQQVAELASAVEAAGAQRLRLRLQVQSEQLAQQSVIAQLRSDLALALIEAEGDEALLAKGHGPALAAKKSRARAVELGGRVALEEKRAANQALSGQAQLQVQAAEVARQRAQHLLRKSQLGALEVRAGIAGVLQRLGDEQPLRIGQHVAAGAPLARIANQTRLKAEIKIAETQAKDVARGLYAVIDTRNGEVPGKVTRIDPAVQNGTVTIDVALTGPMPAGARPELSVDGTVTLERLPDVLHVARPVGAQGAGPVQLYRLVEGGQTALRVPVTLGRSSVDTVEITAGLQLGDQIIVSDMSAWDAHDRLLLN